MNNSVLLVATREVIEKVRDRAFILFTAFMLLLPIAGGIFGAFFSGSDTQNYRIGLVGEGSEQLGAVLKEQTTIFNSEIEVEPLPNPDAAKSVVEAGDVDVAIVNLDRILSEGQPGPRLETLLQSSAQQVKSARALQQAGVAPDQARSILNPEPLSLQSIGDDDGGASESGPGAIIAQFGMVFLFITIFTYGYWIANGVVEEKSSRVIEVILSTIRPWRLMVGKISDIGLLALCQILLVLGLSLLVVSLTGLDLPPAAFGIFAAVLLWFVLGFAFYSCLFAVAGSLVSKQQDLQYTQLPIMVLIFVGYGAAFYDAFGNPGSLTVQILSFIPPFSPMVMRMGMGEAGTLEVVAAALLTVAATAGLVLLAARLYSGSALRFGARVSLREAWKSSSNETPEPR